MDELPRRLKRLLGVEDVSVQSARVRPWLRVTVRYEDFLACDRSALVHPVALSPGLVRLGRWQDGSDFTYQLDQDAHIAVQSTTRGGKTNLARIVVVGALQNGYEVCGSDISGALLRPFAGPLAAVESRNVADHVRVFQRLVDDMYSVVDALADAGAESWRDLPGVRPRLVVIEELPGLLARARQDDGVAGRSAGNRLLPRLEDLIGELTAQGAKAGIVVLALAQRFDAALLGGQVRNNFATRVTLRGEPVMVTMLHPGADAEQAREHMTFPPGQGRIEAPGVAPSVFRADRLGGVEYLLLLQSYGFSARRSEAQAAR